MKDVSSCVTSEVFVVLLSIMDIVSGNIMLCRDEVNYASTLADVTALAHAKSGAWTNGHETMPEKCVFIAPMRMRDGT